MARSVVGQQRGAFFVGVAVSDKDLSRRSQGRGDEHQRSDDDGEDPAQGDDAGGEAVDGDAQGQQGGGKTHSVVVVQGQEGQWHQQEVPDQHVGDDAQDQALAVGVEQDGSVPEDCVHDPGDGQGQGGQVDGEPVVDVLDAVGLVHHVQAQQVQQVGHQQELAEEEVVSLEQVEPEEAQQVVHDEVVANNVVDSAALLSGGGLVLGEEAQDKAQAQHVAHGPKDQHRDEQPGERGAVLVGVVVKEEVVEVPVDAQCER